MTERSKKRKRLIRQVELRMTPENKRPHKPCGGKGCKKCSNMGTRRGVTLAAMASMMEAFKKETSKSLQLPKKFLFPEDKEKVRKQVQELTYTMLKKRMITGAEPDIEIEVDGDKLIAEIKIQPVQPLRIPAKPVNFSL